jgi:hypothetical protein
MTDVEFAAKTADCATFAAARKHGRPPHFHGGQVESLPGYFELVRVMTGAWRPHATSGGPCWEYLLTGAFDHEHA